MTTTETQDEFQREETTAHLNHFILLNISVEQRMRRMDANESALRRITMDWHCTTIAFVFGDKGDTTQRVHQRKRLLMHLNDYNHMKAIPHCSLRAAR